MDMQEYAFKNGLAKIKLSEGELFDMSFAEYAAKSLDAPVEPAAEKQRP